MPNSRHRQKRSPAAYSLPSAFVTSGGLSITIGLAIGRLAAANVAFSMRKTTVLPPASASSSLPWAASGTSLSRMILAAFLSPDSASSHSLSMIRYTRSTGMCSLTAASRRCCSSKALLRAPLGRPAGLPETPARNCPVSVRDKVSAALEASIASLHEDDSRPDRQPDRGDAIGSERDTNLLHGVGRDGHNRHVGPAGRRGKNGATRRHAKSRNSLGVLVEG